MGQVAGIVLAGGRSSRMGTPKAALEWHGSTLLRHVTGVVGRAVDGPVIVVRAPGQELPELDARVRVEEDPAEGRGPLQGLAVGLSAGAAASCELAFVCSTDLPFLHAAFVGAVMRVFGTDAAGSPGAPRTDVVLPLVRGYRQPMAAGYRTDLASRVDALVDRGQLRPGQLFAECNVHQVDESVLLADERLAAADPDLDSVVNVNDPDDYAAARGRPAPEVDVRPYGVPATRGGRGGTVTVRAATLGAAAEQVGMSLGDRVVVDVNGERVRTDRPYPLLAGDTVAFIPADAGG